MGCTRSRSRIWGKCAILALFWTFFLRPSEIWAALASQFSLTLGEQYSDNIFFSKNKESDFVTVLTPTLSIYYAPIGQAEPTLNLNISPSARFYARHDELNSFGDTTAVDGGYTYHHSPRLTLNISERFQRQGQSRMSALGGGQQTPLTPTSPFPQAMAIPSSASQNLRDYVSRGDQLSNEFAIQGNFLFRPDMSFSGGYSNTYSKFLSAGGSDWTQKFSIRGIYNWKQEHNLHAGYSVAVTNLRNGDNGFIHDFDFGDDYFTSQALKVQITPTLSLAASTGLSLNTSNSGPRVANNSAITVTKLWETASLSSGVRKGLTPSFGVSGVSDTTSLFANFAIQLAESISASSSADFSYFDTKDVNFKTFQVSAGIQYLMTSWLSSNLTYSFRRINSGAGAANTDLLTRGTVSASNVFLTFTARFDIWPNTGLARSNPFGTGAATLRTPFPIAPASPTPANQPANSSSGAN